MTNESWKEIAGYEGYYEVSNLGRVRSVKRVVKDSVGRIGVKEGTIRAIGYNKRGYLCVGLHRDGKRWMAPPHRLVAIAFIPNPENKPTVNHISGDKGDNSVNNLEWATYQEQSDHSIKMGLFNNTRAMKVIQFDLKTGEERAEFKSAVHATKATGINRSSINKVCGGKVTINNRGHSHTPKSAGGYGWKFA